MSIITTTSNNFNYKSPVIFTNTIQNETTQTISGDVKVEQYYTSKLTYNSTSKKYVSTQSLSYLINNFTIYYYIVNVTITKPSINTDLSFYQLTEAMQMNDPCITSPANKNSTVDTIQWVYLTSTVITNGYKIRLELFCFDDDENVLDISDLTITTNVKIIPIY